MAKIGARVYEPTVTEAAILQDELVITKHKNLLFLLYAELTGRRHYLRLSRDGKVYVWLELKR